MMCQDERWLKVEAAFNAGLLSNDVVRSCIPLLLLYLREYEGETVSEQEIRTALSERYEFSVAPPFMREVISLAKTDGILSAVKSDRYRINRDKISGSNTDRQEIIQRLDTLAERYREFCLENHYDLPVDSNDLVEWVIGNIRRFDSRVLKNEIVIGDGLSSFHWCEFVLQLESSDPELFKFVASLSYSSVLMDATFFVAKRKNRASYSSLNVFLDTPVVLALLGLDGEERVSAVRYVVNQLKGVGCSLSIFMHNLEEVERIIKGVEHHVRVGDFAYYRANRVGKSFFNKRFNAAQITLFRLKIVEKLSKENVRIFDGAKALERVDSQQLQDVADAIKANYEKKWVGPENDLSDSSVEIDARSLCAVLRLRNSNVGSMIATSQQIMISLNDSLSAVARNLYNGPRNHVPPCVSADLFGAVLWMEQPESFIDYKAHRLLSDCALLMKPTQAMIKRLADELKTVAQHSSMSEDDLALLQASSAVDGALMESIRCDVANINASTPRDVCDRIRNMIKEEVSGELRREQAYRENERRERMEIEAGLNARLDDLVRFNAEIKRHSGFVSAWRTVSMIRSVILLSILVSVVLLMISCMWKACFTADRTIKAIFISFLFILSVSVVYGRSIKQFVTKVSLVFARRLLSSRDEGKKNEQ